MSRHEKSKKCCIVMAIVVVCFAFACAASANTEWGKPAPFAIERQKLLGEYSNDNFGSSVSISGDYAVIGAAYGYGSVANSGSAYIFKWDGTSWIQQAKLTASDGAAEDYFGSSVSISGDYAIIGAYWDDDKGLDSGSAYIFKRNETSWNQQAKLTASDGAAGDWFGYSVSISGDYAIVGAYYDDSGKGSAYIFKWNGINWVQQPKLLASDGTASDCFGVSVSISGDYAIIGANGDDDNVNGNNSGSAYVFNHNGASWNQQAKLTASDGAANDQFGVSVSVSNDYAIVGACGDDNFNGSAYIFNRNGTNWFQQQKLFVLPHDATNNRFGYSVAISSDHAIAGAYSDADKGAYSGSAYIFKRSETSWGQQQKLLASTGATYDYFGWSVSISGDHAIVGANYPGPSNATGSAYAFRFCPRADLNDDCKVDFADFAISANWWLYGTN